MAKVPATQIDSTFQKMSESNLTGTELKVFSAWFKDAKTFSACPRILADRTGIAQSSVRRAIKGLIDKGVLVPSNKIKTSTGQYVQAYDYGDIPSAKEEVQISIESSDTEDLEGGTSMCPIYTNTHTNNKSKSKKFSEDNIFQEEDITVNLDEL